LGRLILTAAGLIRVLEPRKVDGPRCLLVCPLNNDLLTPRTTTVDLIWAPTDVALQTPDDLDLTDDGLRTLGVLVLMGAGLPIPEAVAMAHLRDMDLRLLVAPMVTTDLDKVVPLAPLALRVLRVHMDRLVLVQMARQDR
jgi:hypothetical protein